VHFSSPIPHSVYEKLVPIRTFCSMPIVLLHGTHCVATSAAESVAAWVGTVEFRAVQRMRVGASEPRELRRTF
jgi:hypothetical protein